MKDFNLIIIVDFRHILHFVYIKERRLMFGNTLTIYGIPSCVERGLEKYSPTIELCH
jgi:hypothetical protein